MVSSLLADSAVWIASSSVKVAWILIPDQVVFRPLASFSLIGSINKRLAPALSTACDSFHGWLHYGWWKTDVTP